jgi:hypothetical protein
MAATKQTTHSNKQLPASKLANNMPCTKTGEQPIINSKNRTMENTNIKVFIDGKFYSPDDMVSREIAVKITGFNYSYFSRKIRSGDIIPEGFGTWAKFKVADCLKIAKKPVKEAA